MTSLESKLRRMVGCLDAAALEALASKGLLRRAQKDLERGVGVAVLAENGPGLRLSVGDFEILMPEAGPAASTCSCPSAGVCQHILMAVLFLQRNDSSAVQEFLPEDVSAPTKAPETEFLELTPEQLERWAGKGAFKAGLKLASHSSPEVLLEGSIRVRFMTINAEVRFVPGAGLDGIIVSGGRMDDRALVVAAMVGFQRAQGKEWLLPADTSILEASEGAPRSRNEILQACEALLVETVANGLSRLSGGNQQRWETLAVSALGVNLPRLALLIRGVGEEISLALARDARSDPGRLLARLAQALALCTALENGGESPRADLVGLHRTRYDEIGNVDLVGVSAWPWRTASGYEGLTVLFWEPSAKGWNSWTESRPRHQLADFRPAMRYTQPGPWEGAESPRQLSRRAFRLMGARRNPGHRLSSSGRSRVLVTGATGIAGPGLVAMADWAELWKASVSLTAVGLAEVNPLAGVFVIKPTLWGAREYNPITQVFRWEVADKAGQTLDLELHFDELTEPGIKFLESLAPEAVKDALIVGRLQRTSEGITMQPYSLHLENGKIIHLGLDQIEPAMKRPTVVETELEEGFEAEEEAGPALIHIPALSQLLDQVEDGLLALAEAGLAAVNWPRIEKLRGCSKVANRLGLQKLSAGLNNLIDKPDPKSVLRCVYLAQLHRRAMPLST